MCVNKINVITFGCRLNAYESEVMRTIAQGVAPENTVIINTCAVTKEAERQASQTIRKIRKKKSRCVYYCNRMCSTALS